jgi:Uma2 family endonuclease
MVTTKPLTADDLWEINRDRNDRLELIRGELVRMPATGGRHGRLGSRLDRRLGGHVETHQLGEVYLDTGFRCFPGENTVIAPDFAFIRADRVPAGDEEVKFLNVVPDLVVEIISPSNTPSLVTTKIGLYLEVGVSIIWALEPGYQSVTVHQRNRGPLILGGDDVLDGGDVIPGFSVRVGDLFAPPNSKR